MKIKFVILVGVLVVIVLAIRWNNNRIIRNTATSVPESPQAQVPSAAKNPNCTPTFEDGGGPYYKLNVPFRQNIAPDENKGEKLIVQGKILRQDCSTPLAGSVLDIWQANESGSYEDEWYRGKVTASEDGSYMFETVVPKGYGEGTGYRPPHIHFKANFNNQEIITSQMFLPAAREQQIEEAYIIKVETKEENGTKVHYGYHDIILPI
jgi:protocatechuate 3,4-dioxygenase beta subunit